MRAPRHSHLIVAGLMVTLVLLSVMVPTHLADRLENLTWDLRVRSLPGTPADPRIVHIDIDDSSLLQFGRWPWPRRDIGRVIDTLREAGAAVVMLDIEFPEPQEPERRALLVVFPDSDPKGRSWVVDNDGLLTKSIAAGPTVFLAASADMKFAHAMPEPPPDSLIALAERNLKADAATAAKEAGIPLVQAARDLLAAKRLVIHRKLADWLADQPAAGPRTLERLAIEKILGEDAVGVQTIESGLVREELERLRGLREMATHAALGTQPAPEVGRLNAPLAALAAAGKRVGFTTVVPDPDDFVVRSVPLVASYEGKTYPHLAFAVACDLLGVGPGQIDVVPGERIELTCRDGRTVRIPVDEHCQMLVNWAEQDAGRAGFRHVPIKAIATIYETAEQIETNPLRFHEAAEIAFFEPFNPEQEDYFDWIFELQRYERILRADRGEQATTRTTEDERKIRQRIEVLRTSIEKRRKKHREMVAFVAAFDPTEAGLSKEEREKILIARGLMNVEDANAENRQVIRSRRARLRQLVEGRVCLVGSVATAAADFVPTPLMARTPGVFVHSNVINTILTGRFIRTTPHWLSLVLPLLIGAVTSWLAASLQPKWTLVYAIVGIVVWGGLAFLLWGTACFWLPMAMPLLAIILPWAGVIGFREMTTERRARWISRKFGQYTSPALLNRLSEGSQLGLEGESRHLTVFISDLRGFTSLSERLGPTKIVRLLNRYFEAMTEQLFTHEACVSKYVGDGIFAFFNAPVDQKDHALRACRAALDCQNALIDLRERLEAEFADLLHMRIGIGTGPVVVGNCGSELKFDYTVIGDTVNVASRLEGANKYLGTKILINNEVAAAAGAEMLMRPLGRVGVVGREQPVDAQELICSLVEATENQTQLVERFAEALADYQSRRWKKAQVGFRQCLELAPDDGPARLYLDLVDIYRRRGTPPDWDGSLRLESK